jgi:hypothetical protein
MPSSRLVFQHRPSLATLRAAEAFYDGPFDPNALVNEDERHEALLAAARHARCQQHAKFRIALGFVRRHRAQGRPDLAEIMLGQAREHRQSFRAWNRRFIACRDDASTGLTASAEMLRFAG